MPEIISEEPEKAASNLSKETNPDKKLVWMVEDRADYAQAAMSAGAMFDEDFSLIHFQTGEEAENRFQELIETHDRLPDIVLMDYQLDQGVQNPKYRNGVEVMRILQQKAKEANLAMPEIIAISGDKKYSQEMLEAGAARAVDKLKMLDLFKELAGRK